MVKQSPVKSSGLEGNSRDASDFKSAAHCFTGEPSTAGCHVAGGIIVRPADTDDWPHIWPIWKQVVERGETHPYPTDSTEQDAIALWLEPSHSAVYVAEQTGSIVAAMMIKPMRYGNGDHVANFDLIVSLDHRGRGIGRILSTYVMDAARRAGYSAMEAYAVVETNAVGVRLWCSLGFRIVATIPAAFRHPACGLVAIHHMHRLL